MTSSPTPPVGPPPPYDPECGSVLAGLPTFPPLTLEAIPGFRAAADLFMPRPTDGELTRGGRFEVAERTVPGPTGAPDVSVVVLRVAAATAPTPVLLYVHGGGMFGGTARDALGPVVDLAETVGAAVVSVGYRLAPETRHPGPVEDCSAALRWVAQDAGFDPGRVVLVGGSAGGGIAAAVTLMARDRQGPALAGQLLMSPMLDDRNDSPSVRQLAGQRMWNRADNAVGWTALLGDARGGPDVSPYAAPSRATDLTGLPPTFVDVGSADSFRSEDMAFAEAIWLAGGQAELHVWPGGYHGFEAIAPQAALSRAAVAARGDWLRRVLRPCDRTGRGRPAGS